MDRLYITLYKYRDLNMMHYDTSVCVCVCIIPFLVLLNLPYYYHTSFCSYLSLPLSLVSV